MGYSLKQIGTGDMANSAITSSKPAESFMKRVTLLDISAGNALGWNPESAGNPTQFLISESAISGPDEVFFTIEVVSSNAGNPNHQCDVVGHNAASDFFVITCDTSPPDNSELHYVVGNLPAHLIL